MKDKLMIATKYKKTIDYIHKITDNYPHNELELKSRIINNTYDILEYIYITNINKEKGKLIIPKIKMLDYYMMISYKKNIITKRKYEVISNYLLEIIKMLYGWLNEKSK